MMTYPDVLAILIPHVRAALVTAGRPATVVADLTATPAAACVWMAYEGGQRGQVFERGRVRVNVFDADRAAVESLARLVDGILSTPTGAVVFIRRSSGPIEITDAKPRRYLLFDVTVRGTGT